MDGQSGDYILPSLGSIINFVLNFNILINKLYTLKIDINDQVLYIVLLLRQIYKSSSIIESHVHTLWSPMQTSEPIMLYFALNLSS